MTQYTGKFEIRTRVGLLETMEGAKLDNPLAKSRKPVKGARNYGFSEDAETPTMTGDIPARRDLMAADIFAIVDDVVTFEGDDGTIWTMNGASVASVNLVGGGDSAKYTVVIIGTDPCDQS